jgi:protein phosphatase 1 regulatory subunit 7
MGGVENLLMLHKLELYDNHIEEITSIGRLSHLRILDLSFNAIREMIPLSASVPLLEELYLAQNKLREVKGLEGLIHLKTLDLGANRIRVSFSSIVLIIVACCCLVLCIFSFSFSFQVIEGLETNTSLKSLWLGKNKIERVSGLESLHSLEQLDIQNNRLTSLDKGITHLHKLKELYLACNRIESIENEFPSPNELSTIDLSTNGLKSLVGAEQLIQLEEFWLSSSGFHSFDDLLPLTLLNNLKCVYLEHSPIAKDFEYRKTVTKMIPTLEQLDATQVHRY